MKETMRSYIMGNDSKLTINITCSKTFEQIKYNVYARGLVDIIPTWKKNVEAGSVSQLSGTTGICLSKEVNK